MSNKKSFFLATDRVRSNALEAVRNAPPDYVVTVAEPTRSGSQNAKLHAMLTDLAASPLTWAGKRRTVDEWKMLVVSGHSVATNHGGEVIPGLENEFVAIRESTASMGVKRAASLIEYLLAFCISNGVELHETKRGGFYDELVARERDAA